MTGWLFGPSAALATAQTVRGLWTAAVTYFLTPNGQQMAANIAEGISQAPPGSMGSLTLSSGVSRLRDAEISSGLRLAAQKGLHLLESSHVGADFVEVGTRKTYDVIGQVGAYKNWNAGTFFDSIQRHLNKSVGYIVIDLAGASKQQIQQIRDYVSKLSRQQQARIVYVN
jgi:hypothetical protein